ncbi:MAG: SpvB/TcaC N-terminal domain-containing protein, partial [Myxococcota bacterium]
MNTIRLCIAAILVFASTYASASPHFQDTEGALEVGSSGEAIYTVPIALPPSPRKVGPKLELVYTSGGGVGIAGMGWSLSSVSAISPIAHRRDIDGHARGVRLDGTDVYALDGQRLLLVSGTHGTPGAVYQTEHHSHLKIEILAEAGGINFLVTGADGSRSWYGSSQEDDATDNGTFYIRRFQDRHGNTILYRYTRPFGAKLLVDYVAYGLHASVPTEHLVENRVRFQYRQAERSERAFAGGNGIERKAILASIAVSTDGQIFRDYVLNHDTSPLGYERVVSIQAFNRAGVPANPIVFEYEDSTNPGAVVETQETYVNALEFEAIAVSGDFDGDQRLDFVTNSTLHTGLFTPGEQPVQHALPFSPSRRTTFPVTAWTDDRLHDAQALVHVEETDTHATFSVHHLVGNTVQLAFQRTIALDNIGVHTSVPPGACDTFAALDAMVPPPLSPVGGGNSVYTRTTNRYIPADFTGDHRSDILVFAPQEESLHCFPQDPEDGLYNPAWDPDVCYCEPTSEGHALSLAIYLVTLEPGLSDQPATPGFRTVDLSGLALAPNHAIRVNDFDGDGRSDILAVDPFSGAYELFGLGAIGDEDTTVVPELLGSGTLPHYQPSKSILEADFNGDGKVDLLIPHHEQDETWSLLLANPQPGGGSAFDHEEHEVALYWPSTGDHYDTQVHYREHYAMDFNGDGKADVVEVWRKYYKPLWTINDHDTQWRIRGFANHLGHGAAGGGFTLDYASSLHDDDSPDLPIPVVGAYEHRGLSHEVLMVRNHHHELTTIDFAYRESDASRLTRVVSSGGSRIDDITYARLDTTAEDGSVYSVRGDVTAPRAELAHTHNFVVAHLTNTAAGHVRHQDFRYRGHSCVRSHGCVGVFGHRLRDP